MITTLIRKLPAPAEFCLVVFVCSWWAIYGSIVAIHHSGSTPNPDQARYSGIGVELGAKDNKIIVTRVVPNTPASAAGLARGLVIQSIDGTTTEGKQPENCRDMARGPAGSKVKLELVDTVNNTTNTVELTREYFQATAAKPHTTDRTALTVALLELFGLAVAFWILRIRCAPLGAWGFSPSWKLTGAGVLLAVAMTVLIAAMAATANRIFPGMVHKHSISDLSLPVLVLFSVVNAGFEEALESGYFVQSLQRYGMWSAVLASATFRAFLHAYHGVAALVIILPLGLIFGLIYWKWRRLWPLFIAHVLFDLSAYFPGLHGA